MVMGLALELVSVVCVGRRNILIEEIARLSGVVRNTVRAALATGPPPEV